MQILEENYLSFQFSYMECALGRSGHGGSGLKKEEKRSEYSIGDCEGRHKQETVIEVKINFSPNIQLFN